MPCFEGAAMRLITLAAITAGILLTEGAMAQTARKDTGNNAQLMQQMQQLASERTQLQAENARMKRELDEVRKERDSLKGEREASDKRLRNSEALALRAGGDRKQVEDELAQTRE